MTRLTARVSVFDASAGIWRTVDLPVTAGPVAAPVKRPGRRYGPARPSERASLGTGPAFAFGMDDTAFAEAVGERAFADMRSFVPEPAIKTHRAPTVFPAGGTASDAAAGTRWHDL
jgi:hypothetical protein